MIMMKTDEGVYISEVSGHKVYLKDGRYYVEMEDDSGETRLMKIGAPTVAAISESPLETISPSATTIAADTRSKVLRLDPGSSTLSWGAISPAMSTSASEIMSTSVSDTLMGSTSSYIDPWWHSIKVERSAGGHWPGAVESERKRRADIFNGIMKNIDDLQVWLEENVRSVVIGYDHCFNASDISDGREFVDNGGFLD